MTDNNLNLTALAPDIGRALHGKPTEINERANIMRWSRSGKRDGGSIQLDTARGVFRDWGEQRSFGVLKWLIWEREAADEQAAWEWLKQRGFIRDDGALVKPVQPPPKAKPPMPDVKKIARARELAQDVIPLDHPDAAPARAWLARKIPTWQDNPPRGMAFATPSNRAIAGFGGGEWVKQDGFAGALVFGLRSIRDWILCHRSDTRPPLSAVQCIGIRADGAQVADNKRSHGYVRGSVWMLDSGGVVADSAVPGDAIEVGVCEGIADAISIVSMVGIPAIATIGMPNAGASYVGALTKWGGVNIFADNDGPKFNKHGKHVLDGMQAGGALMRELNRRAGDGYARLYGVRDGMGKDMADLAAAVSSGDFRE